VIECLGRGTTLSTFSFETSRLIQQGSFSRALGNRVGGVVLGQMAVPIGMFLPRLLQVKDTWPARIQMLPPCLLGVKTVVNVRCSHDDCALLICTLATHLAADHDPVLVRFEEPP
jgi:hypothetical protein